ncbi:MAG: endonuclease MutS2 [Clostridia bacterium]|nr:endonuclease MutS2 [Clostridia bacterium]
MIDDRALTTLEFDKILLQLSSFVQSGSAKEKVLSLRPKTVKSEAEQLLKETLEADRVLFDFAVSPSFAVDDLTSTLSLVKKFATLSIPDILKVGRCLATSRRVITALEKVNNIPILIGMTAMLFSDKPLEDAISSAFISDNDLSDNASNALRQIRMKIRKQNASIKSTLIGYTSSASYSKYLQDNIVTIRSDRYVIPVKSEFKGAIAGLVHDQSASGSTLYIEPMAIVNMNNELKSLLSEEKAEIERILRDFSMRINAIADPITISYERLVDMDVIFARAQLAKAQKATCPELNEKGIIDIKNGRHPLIDFKTVVPISIKVEKDVQMLLITGPNTGGKTVTLKLVGLFTAMGLAGLFVPATMANLAVFDSVYCDIGDEQSIEQSLSTFSAHIKNIINIIDKMTPESLLLMDELGAGTDPSEGAALAVSISKYVLDYGAKSVVTSHFNDLKEFALSTDLVATASMDFDIKTFAPTYRLIMGAVGASNALKIAIRLGLRADIIEDAESRISKEKRDFDNVLTSAEETRRRAERIVLDAEGDRQKASMLLREAEKEKTIISQKREKLDETIRKETKRLIENSIEEANETIEEIKDILAQPVIEEADVFKAQKLRKKLENMSAHYDEESIVEFAKANESAKIGDKVFVTSLGNIGILHSISSRGEAEVRLGKIVVKVKKDDYYKVKK